MFRTIAKRSTIKDVAAEANVSISTVSLVTNKKGYVSPETTTRVLQAARKLSYSPRRAARNLSSDKTGNIGFVLRSDHFMRNEPFYSRIFLGTEFEADNHRWYVLLTTIPKEYVPIEHTPRFLRERNVDGIIVAGKVDPAFFTEVEGAGIPVVLIDFEMDAYPAVVIDNLGGARAAVDHLLDRGHSDIAFLGADMSHPSLSERLEGFQLAIHAAGESLNPARIIIDDKGEPVYETGMVLSERLFACDPTPTAVFCVNDALAFCVLDQAARRGLLVPDDIAVVGFDDVPRAEHSHPPLTTVRVYKEQMGELAIRYLKEQMSDLSPSQLLYDRGSHTVKVPTELIVRASSLAYTPSVDSIDNPVISAHPD
ncbi:MAG: LacI family DNA-binding transcriptional regulator [Bacteroidetes bacterium]|nr:LacI family DNA-binding transcriptional regulator [Bacteroidota bacterium]